MQITGSHRSVREPKVANIAPAQGRGIVRDRARGRGSARGVTPPRGQTRSTSAEPTYKLERPTDPIQLPSAPEATPSVQMLVLIVLAGLEGAPLATATVDALVSTTPVCPLITVLELTMIHVSYSSVLVDSPMTAMILPLTSRSSFGYHFQSLAIALSVAPPLFMVPPSSTSPSMSTVEQKSSERFVGWLFYNLMTSLVIEPMIFVRVP